MNKLSAQINFLSNGRCAKMGAASPKLKEEGHLFKIKSGSYNWDTLLVSKYSLEIQIEPFYGTRRVHLKKFKICL